MTDIKNLPLLIPERIEFLKKSESKKCVFDSLTTLLEKEIENVSKNDIFDALISREKLGNTYIGNGIAIPRAYIDISEPRAALLILKKGLNLNSADKKAITLFLGVLIPEKNREKYSDTLSEFNKKLLLEKDLESIINTGNAALVAENFNRLFN